MIEPYFLFKNIHSINDMECYTGELPEVAPIKIYESKKVRGRSGRLNMTHGDYDSYEYSIEIQLANFDRLQEVKRWLTGTGKLILSTDLSKYRDVIVTNSGKPIEYENEDGFFWKFQVTFQSEPFRKYLSEKPIPLPIGKPQVIDNSGDETCHPLIRIVSNGGNVSVNWNNNEFTLLNTPTGELIIDSETGLVIADGARIKNKGERPRLKVGNNTIKVSGNIREADIVRRCVFL